MTFKGRKFDAGLNASFRLADQAFIFSIGNFVLYSPN